MATFTTKTLTCPICQQTFDRELQTSFNTERDGEDLVKIYDPDYFDHVCPHCGEMFEYQHDILVYSPESNVMIQFLPLEDVFCCMGDCNEFHDLVEVKHREFLELQDKNFIPQSVQYRTVFEIRDIIEKLTTFSFGYDDRAMEMTKIFSMSICNTQPEESKIDHLRFGVEYDQEDENGVFLRFFAFDEDDECFDSINFIEELYKDLELDARNFYAEGTVIDSNWALSTMMNMQNALFEEAKETKKPTKSRNRQKKKLK